MVKGDTVRKQNGRKKPRVVVVVIVIVAALLVAIWLLWDWKRHQPATPVQLPLPQQGDYVAFDHYATESIKEMMRKHNIVGLSAAVVVGDRIAWSKGFGYADREAQSQATPETIYRVGSIAKIPNAIAVLKLMEDGKLDINAPINRYIPEFAVKSRFGAALAITPRQLMTHHSGLPNVVKGMWGERPAPFQSVVDLLRGEYISYPPGTAHSYCNLGADLLGVMLERVSGMEYNAVLQDAVLAPLAMVNSAYVLRTSFGHRLAQGYDKAGQPQAEVSIRDVPSGNLYTTVQDMGNLLVMLLNGGVYGGKRLLTEQAVRDMLSPQNSAVPLDGNFKMGYEFFLQDPSLAYAGSSFTHGGHMHLFHSQIVGVAEQQVAVVVMANSAGAAGSVRGIAGWLLRAAISVKSGLEPSASAAARGAAALPPGLPAPATYAGDYGTLLGLLRVRQGESGQYTADLQGKTVELIPDDGPWLRPRYRLLGLDLTPAEAKDLRIASRTVAGEDIVFIQRGARVTAVGKRIGDYHVPQAWRSREGVYQTADAENQLLRINYLEVRMNKAGFLMMKLEAESKDVDLGELVLYPVSDREVIVYALGLPGMMETIRAVEENGQEKLVFSGIAFERRR